MQDYGDLVSVKASEGLEELADPVVGKPTTFAGTMGESKRMEALTIAFDSGIQGVSLKYQAHVEGDGWLTEVPVTKEGTTIAGTKNQYRRMEALKLTVEGLDKLHQAGYEIEYRAHVEGYGWQDWVTADDQAYNLETKNFAGTTGEYKRVEAIEIAVVHVHDYTTQYTHSGVVNGVSQHIYKCSICGETGTEECTYGAWGSTDGQNATRACVCGHTETKKLKDVLQDENVTELEVDKVSTALTVPASKTLTVDEKLENGADIAVKGTLVMKKMPDQSAKLTGTGTVVWAPEASNTEEINKLPSALKLSGNAVTDPKNTLKYEIKLPELAKPLTITDKGESDYLTIGEGYNITLDLGGNTLAFDKSQSLTRDGLILNKGTLTIKNGTLSDNGNTNVTAKAGKYILKNVKDTKKLPILSLENVTITTKGDGIAAEEGTLTMVNSSITAGGKDCVGLSVGYSDTANGVHKDMGKSPVTLENVKINNVGYGVIAHSTNATVTLNNVDIKATNFALHVNAKDTKNNSFVVTGGTYEVTDAKAAVAYLAGTNKSTFTNCTLKGANGIETAGSELTLDNVTINATGKTTNGAVKAGESTERGSAVILKVLQGYGDKKIDLTVRNSKLNSANGYAVSVAGNTSSSTVQKINISYDSNSFVAATGKSGVQNIDSGLLSMTTTVSNADEEVIE